MQLGFCISGSIFNIEAHPSDFKDIYSNHKLPSDTSNKIYNPDIYKNGKLMYHWGIKMDFAIRNLTNNKCCLAKLRDKMVGLKIHLPQRAEEMHMNEAANILHQVC